MFDKNNLKYTLKAIDETIEKLNSDVRRGKLLAELKQDPRFKEVILDGYFEVEAKELFNILTDPSGASPYSNEEIQLKLAAISHFKSYVGTDEFVGAIEIKAQSAPSRILEEEQYRLEVTADIASGDNNE